MSNEVVDLSLLDMDIADIEDIGFNIPAGKYLAELSADAKTAKTQKAPDGTPVVELTLKVMEVEELQNPADKEPTVGSTTQVAYWVANAISVSMLKATLKNVMAEVDETNLMRMVMLLKEDPMQVAVSLKVKKSADHGDSNVITSMVSN